MASVFTLELLDAFVVRPEALKKISTLFSDRIGKTKFFAECADNITREFTDVTSFMNYENAKAKQLLNLDVVARSEDSKTTAKLSFTNKWYFGGIRVSIEARDDVVSRLRSELLDVLSGMRPWYWPISKINFAIIPLLIFGIVVVSSLVDTAWRGSNEPSPIPPRSTPQSTAITLLYMIGCISVLGGVFFLAHRLRKVVFPHGTFLIGQEAHRYDVLEKWRWGLGVSIIASLIAGVGLLWFT